MAQPLSDAQTNVRFNVMTLGQHCAGKTAFFRSLLQSEENNSADCSESESYAKDIFREQRLTNLSAPKVIKIVEVGRSGLKTKNDDSISLVMYDTQSYEDFVYDKSLVDAICDHIDQSHSAWRSLDLQALSARDILDQDTRIHCVFFFLNAEGIKENDLYFLAKLSGKVSVVPVIEEGDVMTISKRNSYLGDLHTAIENLSATLGKPTVYNFVGTQRGTEPRLKISEPSNSLMKTAATGKQKNSSRHVSGETSKESSAEKGIRNAESNAESSFAPQTSTTNANDRKRRQTYSPSPEFTALLSTAVDFDGSVASVSSDDRSFPRNMEARSVSIGSIDTTEISNNLRHPTGLHGQESGLPPSIDGAVSNNSAFSKNEMHRLGEFSSSEDQSHSEIFFNQETFVNVGRALSNSAIYGDTPSTGSEDMVHCSHLNAGIPTFEDIEEDMEYEDWAEGDVSSIMMDSTVLIGLPRPRGGGSRPDVFGMNSLKSDSNVTPTHKTVSDEIRRNSPISVPAEAMICKVVSNLVCSSIADKKEQAVCRLVSRIACSQLPKNNSVALAPLPIPPSKLPSEYLSEGHDKNDFDAVNYNEALANTYEVRLDGDYSIDGADDHSFFEKAGSAATRVSATSIPEDAHLHVSEAGRSFEVNANGLHVYHNFFSISCPEVSLSLHSDSADCNRAVRETTKNSSRGIAQNQEDSDNSDDVHSSESASSWAPISSVNSLGSSMRMDEEVHVGDADMRRLHGLLFEGQHVMALIDQTKRFSLCLFPMRPSSIEVLHSATNRSHVSAGILDSLLQYLDPLAAPLLTFFAVFAERTCSYSPWVTESTHQSVSSTATFKINVIASDETARKADDRKNASTSALPFATSVTGGTSAVVSTAQQNSILSRKHLWLFICNVLMCALVWSGLKGKRVVRVVHTSSDKVVLAAAILDASKSLVIPSVISFSDVDEATIDMTDEYLKVLGSESIVEAESLSEAADDIDTFDEHDFTSRTSSVDVTEMSLLHCKSLHVGDIFECLTGLPMSINYAYNAPSVWGYSQQENSRRVGDASRKCAEGESCGTRGSSSWKARAVERRLSPVLGSIEGGVTSESPETGSMETKPVEEDASDNNLLDLMSQCSNQSNDDDVMLSSCIETELSRVSSQIMMYNFQDRPVTKSQTQWDTYSMYSEKANHYLKMIFEDTIRIIDDLLPNLIELWTSFVDQVEDSFKNTLAFLFSL